MEVKSEELQVYQTPATKSPSTPTKYTNKVYTPSTPTKYTKSPGSKYILKPPSTATKYTKLKHRSIPNSGHQVHQVPQIQAASIPNLANKYTKFSNQSPPKYTKPESTPNLATKYTKSSYKKYSKPKYTNHTKSSQKVCQISRFGWSHHKILNSFSTSFFFYLGFPWCVCLSPGLARGAWPRMRFPVCRGNPNKLVLGWGCTKNGTPSWLQGRIG